MSVGANSAATQVSFKIRANTNNKWRSFPSSKVRVSLTFKSCMVLTRITHSYLSMRPAELIIKTQSWQTMDCLELTVKSGQFTKYIINKL